MKGSVRFVTIPVDYQSVTVNINDAAGGLLLRLHHTLYGEVMNASFEHIFTRVMMSRDAGDHGGMSRNDTEDGPVIP